MKTLLIVRHAKSNWNEPDVSDFDRPLNKRGNRDAPFMGKLIMEKAGKPDLIYSSPAERAITTARFFALAMDYDSKDISQQKVIYEHGANAILRMMGKTPDNNNLVMVVGHNPDITYLANYLCDGSLDSLPTCSVACIDFDFDKWDMIAEKPGKLRFFEYPKKYME